MKQAEASDQGRPRPGVASRKTYFAVYILEIKALRQVEVALHCGALPEAPNGVFDLEVDLRAVEGPSTLVHGVVPLLALQGSLESYGGCLPDVVAPDTAGGSRKVWKVREREKEKKGGRGAGAEQEQSRSRAHGDQVEGGTVGGADLLSGRVLSIIS